MSDENPFDDLGGLETEDTSPTDEQPEPATEAASQPSSDSSSTDRVQSDESKREATDDDAGAVMSTDQNAGTDTGTDADIDTGTDVDTETDTDLSGPSFEYAEVQQRPLYVRERTWEEFEDAIGISVVPELRRESVRDEAKREIHDAVITLAVEEPERLVEIILERRRD
ncbi:hypothetical protein [Natronosalvus halobius]|uniref:hypothetical protein n=1 Tax=Natronosalvus halobius TaxID=2953746 RepID=UPI00209D1B67|nr:hypothetical protein [Natronosalvus halobius]USZ72399.1 hypothetical protein NGM15_03550 [Natronosalvus halobius]